MRKELELDSIRSNLIRQEETIIFSIIERAQFAINKKIYGNEINIAGYDGSFFKYMLMETEKVHARSRRYQSPDEVPFSTDLPSPAIDDYEYEWPIKHNSINLNSQILSIYSNDVLPLICKEGDDGNYGSSAVCDVAILQAMSKRIHYGKYVAESKYIADVEGYNRLIAAGDEEGIMEKLTNMQVEEKLLERVYVKASTYGQDPFSEKREYKVSPQVIKDIYYKWIIPLTKDVEVIYLMERPAKN